MTPTIEKAAMLPEDVDERRMFNHSSAVMGGPLVYIQSCLATWHGMNRDGGSYGKMLAIFSNEIAKAHLALEAALEPSDDEVEAALAVWFGVRSNVNIARQDYRDRMHAALRAARLASLGR